MVLQPSLAAAQRMERTIENMTRPGRHLQKLRGKSGGGDQDAWVAFYRRETLGHAYELPLGYSFRPGYHWSASAAERCRMPMVHGCPRPIRGCTMC